MPLSTSTANKAAAGVGDLYIGLISGTSMDGIDAALVQFDDNEMSLIDTLVAEYPDELRGRLAAAIRAPDALAVDELGQLDTWVANSFRDAALALLDKAGLDAAAVRAIGSHGQTIRHRPDAEHRFTLQLGDPGSIATGTGIDTVADFRRADLALGGEGAPLTPPFHRWLFGAAGSDRAVLNVGGIANLTILPGDDSAVTGFDVGPGNSLMDLWVRQHRGQAYDAGGRWAASGTVDDALLQAMLADPWFGETPPKSTGFEYFNSDWLDAHTLGERPPADVQATLCELTAASVADALGRWAPATRELFVCGGGASNTRLMDRLGQHLADVRVASTTEAGLAPDWVEACAFAWLARQTLARLPGSLASVTGASRDAVLGGIYVGSAG